MISKSTRMKNDTQNDKNNRDTTITHIRLLSTTGIESIMLQNKHCIKYYQMEDRSDSPTTIQKNHRCSRERDSTLPEDAADAGKRRDATTPDTHPPCITIVRAWNKVSDIPKAVIPGTGGGPMARTTLGRMGAFPPAPV